MVPRGAGSGSACNLSSSPGKGTASYLSDDSSDRRGERRGPRSPPHRQGAWFLTEQSREREGAEPAIERLLEHLPNDAALWSLLGGKHDVQIRLGVSAYTVGLERRLRDFARAGCSNQHGEPHTPTRRPTSGESPLDFAENLGRLVGDAARDHRRPRGVAERAQGNTLAGRPARIDGDVVRRDVSAA